MVDDANQGQPAGTPQADSVLLQAFAGLRNTIPQEALGPRELARAQNIDIDDADRIHRRRGYRVAALGKFHSLFTTPKGTTLVVKDGTLCWVRPGLDFYPVLAGIGDAPLAYEVVGSNLYATSCHNSFQVELRTMIASPWGLVQDHSYQPTLAPGPKDFWFSPVVNPTADLGPVAGKLLGAPPLGTTLTYFNGRIYIGAKDVLWATELYLFNYVDKTRGFKQFEAEITGLGTVEDGVYVGTRSGLFFMEGTFNENKRTTVTRSAVLPGSAIQVPQEVIWPDARGRPDIPFPAGLAIAFMTVDGLVVCGRGGKIYNLTRSQFIFPNAKRAASFFRQQDGMNQVVSALDSGGTPTDAARIGDYLDATIIRAAGGAQQ